MLLFRFWIVPIHLHSISMHCGFLSIYQVNQSKCSFPINSRLCSLLHIDSIVPKIVTLMNMTVECSVCTSCLWCLNNFVKADPAILDGIVDCGFVLVILNFQHVSFPSSHDTRKKQILSFRTSFCRLFPMESTTQCQARGFVERFQFSPSSRGSSL